MRNIIRNITFYSAALFFATLVIPGFHVNGGIWHFILGGLVLTFLLFIVKPVLHIISFPINVITLGMFSLFTNVIILYLLTVFVSPVYVTSFTFPAAKVFGFSSPPIDINLFVAYCISAVFITMLVGYINWLIE